MLIRWGVAMAMMAMAMARPPPPPPPDLRREPAAKYLKSSNIRR